MQYVAQLYIVVLHDISRVCLTRLTWLGTTSLFTSSKTTSQHGLFLIVLHGRVCTCYVKPCC